MVKATKVQRVNCTWRLWQLRCQSVLYVVVLVTGQLRGHQRSSGLQPKKTKPSATSVCVNR